MNASLPFCAVQLNENEIPREKLAKNAIEENSVGEIKRWLSCRKQSTTGKKAELVNRLIGYKFLLSWSFNIIVIRINNWGKRQDFKVCNYFGTEYVVNYEKRIGENISNYYKYKKTLQYITKISLNNMKKIVSGVILILKCN